MSGLVVNVGRHCLEIDEDKGSRRMGLRPEIRNWLISHLGHCYPVGSPRRWSWTAKSGPSLTKNGWREVLGAEVWIDDAMLALLFKLTWGSV